MDQNSNREPREYVSFTLAPPAVAWLRQIAHENRVSRSEVIRTCLRVAKKYESEVVAALKGRGDV
jgi:hypothetical protein